MFSDCDGDADLTYMQSLNTHDVVSKKIPNFPISRLIHKLKGILVNKDRIHRELGKFLRYLWNSIKSVNELSLEIMQFKI